MGHVNRCIGNRTAIDAAKESTNDVASQAEHTKQRPTPTKGNDAFAESTRSLEGRPVKEDVNCTVKVRPKPRRAASLRNFDGHQKKKGSPNQKPQLPSRSHSSDDVLAKKRHVARKKKEVEAGQTKPASDEEPKGGGGARGDAENEVVRKRQLTEPATTMSQSPEGSRKPKSASTIPEPKVLVAENDSPEAASVKIERVALAPSPNSAGTNAVESERKSRNAPTRQRSSRRLERKTSSRRLKQANTDTDAGEIKKPERNGSSRRLNAAPERKNSSRRLRHEGEGDNNPKLERKSSSRRSKTQPGAPLRKQSSRRLVSETADSTGSDHKVDQQGRDRRPRKNSSRRLASTDDIDADPADGTDARKPSSFQPPERKNSSRRLKDPKDSNVEHGEKRAPKGRNPPSRKGSSSNLGPETELLASAKVKESKHLLTKELAKKPGLLGNLNGDEASIDDSQMLSVTDNLLGCEGETLGKSISSISSIQEPVHSEESYDHLVKLGAPLSKFISTDSNLIVDNYGDECTRSCGNSISTATSSVDVSNLLAQVGKRASPSGPANTSPDSKTELEVLKEEKQTQESRFDPVESFSCLDEGEHEEAAEISAVAKDPDEELHGLNEDPEESNMDKNNEGGTKDCSKSPQKIFEPVEEFGGLDEDNDTESDTRGRAVARRGEGCTRGRLSRSRSTSRQSGDRSRSRSSSRRRSLSSTRGCDAAGPCSRNRTSGPPVTKKTPAQRRCIESAANFGVIDDDAWGKPLDASSSGRRAGMTRSQSLRGFGSQAVGVKGALAQSRASASSAQPQKRQQTKCGVDLGLIQSAANLNSSCSKLDSSALPVAPSFEKVNSVKAMFRRARRMSVA